MAEILGSLYEEQGVSMDTARERALAIFKLLDVNNDGEINEDEFVQVSLY